jgi:FtsP/CotA-like multicopper oxidase with cupredoxin domain
VTISGGQGSAPKYGIQLDGDTDPAHLQFNPGYVNECVEVNTAEEWTIVNETDSGHPFHIHLNPFFVIDYKDLTDVPSTNPASAMYYNNPVNLWQDTLYVPPPLVAPDGSMAAAGMVKIRHRFPDITGTFMQHCHILGHEDRGFMHIVEVHDAGANCSPPPGNHVH